MKSIYFDKKTKFESSDALKKISGISNIYFEKDTTVTFEGKISLNHGINFSGECFIGDGVSIDTGCTLKEVRIGKNSFVRGYSLIENSSFGESNIIGPFCFVRNKTQVGSKCIVGSHVEVTRSIIGSDVKISHQAFIGDANIDNSVIIGAGVVFCNYDGSSKRITHIGKGTMVGSGCMLIAPVKIGSYVTIGAGSVVNKEIKDNTKYIQKR